MKYKIVALALLSALDLSSQASVMDIARDSLDYTNEMLTKGYLS